MVCAVSDTRTEAIDLKERKWALTKVYVFCFCAGWQMIPMIILAMQLGWIICLFNECFGGFWSNPLIYKFDYANPSPCPVDHFPPQKFPHMFYLPTKIRRQNSTLHTPSLSKKYIWVLRQFVMFSYLILLSFSFPYKMNDTQANSIRAVVMNYVRRKYKKINSVVYNY